MLKNDMKFHLLAVLTCETLLNTWKEILYLIVAIL